MRRPSFLTILVFLSLTLVGCNTMSGLGKDVQKAGGAVEDAAEDCQSGRSC